MNDQEVVFGIRPENINIEKNEHSIQCKVELVEPMEQILLFGLVLRVIQYLLD